MSIGSRKYKARYALQTKTIVGAAWQLRQQKHYQLSEQLTVVAQGAVQTLQKAGEHLVI